nr:MAG TPA_asm: hypothetical protein [Bacteriophage sp.]
MEHLIKKIADISKKKKIVLSIYRLLRIIN